MLSVDKTFSGTDGTILASEYTLATGSGTTLNDNAVGTSNEAWLTQPSGRNRWVYVSTATVSTTDTATAITNITWSAPILRFIPEIFEVNLTIYRELGGNGSPQIAPTTPTITGTATYNFGTNDFMQPTNWLASRSGANRWTFTSTIGLRTLDRNEVRTINAADWGTVLLLESPTIYSCLLYTSPSPRD